MGASIKYKDSGAEWIGEIPSTWSIGRIGQLYIERKQKVSDKDYPPLSVTMSGIMPQLDTAAKSDAHDDRKLVLKGDFAINSRSDRRGSCGISAYDGSVSLINTVLKPKGNFSPDYYGWLFKSTMFSDEYYKWGHGIVDDLWTTNWQDMKKIVIPIPSLLEQEKIASFLNKKCNEIDNIIRNTENSIEDYRKLKQSIITEAVTKGISGKHHQMSDSGINWIGEIPASWSMMRMKNCVKQRISGSWGEDAQKNENDVVCMRIADFDYDRLLFNKSGKYTIRNYDRSIISKLQLTDGDILIEKSGGGDKTPVGRAVVFDLGITALYANFMDKIVCKPEYNSRWFAYVFAAFYQNGFTKNYIKQTTGIQNLDLSAMLATEKIPIPPLSEQEQIVEELDCKCSEINDFIDKKKQFISELLLYKQSIIYEYVTGKKEVPEL